MSEPLQLLPWLLTAVLAALWLFTERRRNRASRERDHSARALASASLTLTRISQAVESASDAIGIGDMESNSLYHNRAHLELFGPLPAVLLGSLKGPVNTSPACSTIVSPSLALSRAAWKLPPVATLIKVPEGAE